MAGSDDLLFGLNAGAQLTSNPPIRRAAGRRREDEKKDEKKEEKSCR